jgi:hypothetical protein
LGFIKLGELLGTVIDGAIPRVALAASEVREENAVRLTARQESAMLFEIDVLGAGRRAYLTPGSRN